MATNLQQEEWIATQRIRRIAVEIEDYGYHTPDKDFSGSYDYNKVAVLCYQIAHGLDLCPTCGIHIGNYKEMFKEEHKCPEN